MGMDRDSGQIRDLASAFEARENEAVFERDEVVKIKGAYFSIENILPEKNKIILIGISKEEGQAWEMKQAPGKMRGR